MSVSRYRIVRDFNKSYKLLVYFPQKLDEATGQWVDLEDDRCFWGDAKAAIKADRFQLPDMRKARVPMWDTSWPWWRRLFKAAPPGETK